MRVAAGRHTHTHTRFVRFSWATRAIDQSKSDRFMRTHVRSQVCACEYANAREGRSQTANHLFGHKQKSTAAAAERSIEGGRPLVGHMPIHPPACVHMGTHDVTFKTYTHTHYTTFYYHHYLCNRTCNAAVG